MSQCIHTFICMYIQCTCSIIPCIYISLVYTCVSMVCHSLSLSSELLVQAFFKPGSTINPDHKDKYLHILAYAASVFDSSAGEPHKEELESTKKAIESAHQICSRASASHAELQVEIPTLFEVVKHPIVSVGVLRWVEHTLTDPTFFEEAAESSSLFLVLLDEVCIHIHCVCACTCTVYISDW